MAFALRNQNDDAFDTPPVSDINVTPLVDVMLVLLIVFMVAAPLMTAGIPVDLPKATAKPLVDQKEPISISIDADGKYFVDKREVAADELILVLDESADGKERRIHVRGDKNIAYGKVIEVMSIINSAGYTKVALVSDPSIRPPGP